MSHIIPCPSISSPYHHIPYPVNTPSHTTPLHPAFLTHSFHATTKQAQEDEDHKLAVSVSQDGNSAGGSSRLAAIYQESESSIYRSTPTPTAPSPYAAVSNTSSSSSSKYGSSANVTIYSGNESNIARSKFASNKGISSDQFFGRDEEDMEIMKNRLSKLSTSNAISSDMLASDQAGTDYNNSRMGGGGYNGNSGGYGNSGYGGGGGGGGAGGLTGIDKLKDSVSNFFEDIQRRIG